MLGITTSLMILFTTLTGTVDTNADALRFILPFDQVVQKKEEIVEVDKPMTLESYVREVFADDPVLVEIAKCESMFRQFKSDGKVLRGAVNGKDVGLMQINEHYHADTAKKLGYNINTLEGNIAYAKWLYSKQGSDPWVHSSKCWKKAMQLAAK